jgi:ZIP family zinc transporter
MLQMIVFSAVAGICGTGLGGVFSAIMLKKPSENITCWMLSFAAGVMTSIVCFGLVPEAFVLTNMGVCVIGLILGIVIVLIVNNHRQRRWLECWPLKGALKPSYLFQLSSLL